MNIKKIFRSWFLPIKKTSLFSTFLMLTSMSFIFVDRINNVNLDPVINDFINIQQLFIPLWFFFLFDGGFEDIKNFGFKNVLVNKGIKVIVVNLVLYTFILVIYKFLLEVKLFFL